MSGTSLDHLSPTERSALATFTDEARRICGDRVRAIRAYGSRVRGEGDEDSDLDVFLLLDEHDRGIERRLDNLAVDLQLETGVALDPRVWGASDWFRWLRHERALALAIEQEGVPL